jgi:hypothetical protein
MTLHPLSPEPSYASHSTDQLEHAISLVKRQEEKEPKFLGMLICNDFWRVQQLGDAIERNTLELMNIVSAKYLQAGKMMGRPIYISIVGIFNADRKLWLPDSTDTVDASDLLKVCSRI